LIVKNADGSYSYTSPQDAPQDQSQQQQSQQQQQPQPTKVADLPAEAHAAAAELTSVGNVTFESAFSSVAKGEQISEHDIGQIAGALGIEPSAVNEKVATVRAGFEAQAHQLVGSNSQAIFDFGYQSEPRMMQEAIRAHTQFERSDAYDAVVQKFYETLDRRDPDAILNATNAAEFKPQRDARSGEITVTIGGMKMSWGAACRAGFIGRRK
jgi:hypothetical protein